AFEEAYLGNPELVEQLKLTERLRGGLVDLEARGELPKPTAHRGWAAFLASPQYAAAATLLLVGSLVLSTLLYVENASLRNAPPMTADTRVARLVPLLALRSADDGVNVIRLSDERESIVLLVEAAFSGYETFRVSVRPMQPLAEPLWQVSGIEPDFLDYLAANVPSELLAPGEYEVLVDGIGGDGALEPLARLPFRVEPPQ